VQIPIIGADFLHHHSLLVDMANSRLVDTVMQLKVQGILSQIVSPSPSFFLSQQTTPFTSLIAKYPTVFQPQLSSHNVKHNVTHHIHTKGHPVSARP